jgi:hypothetical protein
LLLLLQLLQPLLMQVQLRLLLLLLLQLLPYLMAPECCLDLGSCCIFLR